MFRRGDAVRVELTPDEERELQGIITGTETPNDAVERYPDSWPLRWRLSLRLLETGDVVRAYDSAVACMKLRPSDPRSKIALSVVYQVMSMAAMADNATAREDWMRAQGVVGPIDDPGVDAQRALEARGLNIDELLADHAVMLDELQQLNVDRGTRRELKRAHNQNRMYRDWRSGAIQRKLEQRRQI
jgi:hypothetical protein